MVYIKVVSFLFFSFVLLAILNTIRYIFDPVYVLYPLGLAGVLSFIWYVRELIFVRGMSLKIYEVLFFGIISSVILALAFQVFFGGEVIDHNGISSMNVSIGVAFRIVVYMLVGYVLHGINVHEKKMFALIALGLILALHLSLSQGGGFVDYFQINQQRPDQSRLDHLTFTEPYIYLYAICLGLYGRKNDLLLWVVVFACLFIAGGRGTLFSFFFSYLLILLKSGPRNKFIYFFAFLLLMLLLPNLFDFNLNSDQVSHMLLLGDIARDESYQARTDIFISSIASLHSQFVFGDPSLIAAGGGMDSYAHNVVSIWQFFGFLPFALTTISVFLVARRLYRMNYSGGDQFSYSLCILFLVSTISLMFFKSLIFPPFWFALGYWLKRLSVR